MMNSFWKVICGTAGALAAVLVVAGPAQAGPVDLTITDLVVSYDGTSLDVASDVSGSALTWTLSDGTMGGTVGSAFLTWDGATGSFTVLDDLLTTLLSGTVYSMVANVANPGPGATFNVNVLLTTSALGLGDDIAVLLGSPNFGVTSLEVGTGTADVTSVPEPATTTLMLLGGAAAALRARSRRRRVRTRATE
jgi:hypothetical protein